MMDMNLEEFFNRTKKIVGKLRQQGICSDVTLNFADQPGEKHLKAPYLRFFEEINGEVSLFDVSIGMEKLEQMDDRNFIRIFIMEFGKEIKRFKRANL
jgi:hypothetical protein